jgi:hypothetical protein
MYALLEFVIVNSSLRFTKLIAMKFYIALFFVIIFNNSCLASFCKSSTELWTCANGIATFNEDKYDKVRY